MNGHLRGTHIVLGIVFTICVSVGLPLIAFLYACFKMRYIPFLLGMLAFISSQILIRLPLLQYLQANSTAYTMFSLTQPLLFAIVIGLSAGVFEGLARFVFMRFFMKQRDWQSGFLFGAGHGGIEAILFVGIGALTMLFSPTAMASNGEFFIAGIERFFAMLLHIGLSIMILQGVVQQKFIYVLWAILIHGFVDTLVGIFPLFMSLTNALIIIEVSLAITAIIMFSYSLLIKRKEVLK